MRVIVIVKASKESEAGVMPDEKMLAEMGKYNEELVKAGIMLAGEGLHPSSKGKRVRFSGTNRTVVDGPFAETKELMAGYWLWQVKSMDEAVEWLKKCPNPHNEESEVEIRPVFEAEDFGAEFTPELREQEQRLREPDRGATEVARPRESRQLLFSYRDSSSYTPAFFMIACVVSSPSLAASSAAMSFGMRPRGSGLMPS